MSAEGQKTAWRQSSIGQIEQQLAKTFPRPSEAKEQLKTMQSAPNFLAEGMHNLASGINKLFTGQPLPTPWGTEAGTVFGLQEARQKWGQQQGIQVNGDIHLYPTNENTYNSIYNELEQSIAPATTAGQ